MILTKCICFLLFLCGSFLISTGLRFVGLDVSTMEVLVLPTLGMVIDLMMHTDFGDK